MKGLPFDDTRPKANKAKVVGGNLSVAWSKGLLSCNRRSGKGRSAGTRETVAMSGPPLFTIFVFFISGRIFFLSKGLFSVCVCVCLLLTPFSGWNYEALIAQLFDGVHRWLAEPNRVKQTLIWWTPPFGVTSVAKRIQLQSQTFCFSCWMAKFCYLRLCVSVVCVMDDNCLLHKQWNTTDTPNRQENRDFVFFLNGMRLAFSPSLIHGNE